MSRNRIEVQVIDEKLLIAGISSDKAPSSENGGSESLRNVEVNLVDAAPESLTLVLSFKNVGRIENLVGFHNLTKLCLDNNVIDEIVNLDHLVQLRWLDLSFNGIKKIKGLENLKQLEDLSLFSNKIDTVEGLEHCTNLQCLSLGNNLIDNTGEIIRLRQLRSIRMLTLAGNVICATPEYKMIVLAYVDNLKYLDYALVSASELHLAKEQYHDELLDVLEKESVNAEKEARDNAMNDYLKELDAAGIVFAHTLFDDMFFEDSDIDKVRPLPNVKEHIEQFRSAFKAASEDYVRVTMEKYDKKKKNSTFFEKSVTTVRTVEDSESTLLIENFNNSKKAAILQIVGASGGGYLMAEENAEQRARIVGRLTAELDRVSDELMSIEMRQVEKFEALIDEYDNHLNDFKNVALEMQQQFFRVVEDLEDKFSTNVRGAASDIIDRLARDELDDGYLDEEVRSLVADKDSCMGIVSASHDMHIGRILKREDEARNTETKRYQEKISGCMQTEKARNRNRILQIHDFYRGTKASILGLLSTEEDEGFDDVADMATGSAQSGKGGP